jgi:GNAT superfamily N-acetyltransferase
MNLSLRRVTSADEEFVFAVYASTREAEMALVPWDELQRNAFLKMQFAAQQQHYWKEYPDSTHQIIEADRRAIGRMWIARGAGEIHILDIALLPTERNAGIGTAIMHDLLHAAETEDKPLTIYVETFNPSLHLFERLGFKQVEQQGVHYLMQWTPCPKS